MFDQIALGREFFEMLTAVDVQIVALAAGKACRFCGGPLHRGDFPRKPRGWLVAVAGETFERRFSLCCGREGCRHRATPPSVRFLGRRVYVGVAVIAASVIALAVATARAAERTTRIAARTVRRWLRWWRGPFTTTAVFVEILSRIAPDLPRAQLPSSLLVQFAGDMPSRIGALLGWLAPLTTASSPDGSRFVRPMMAATMKQSLTQKMA